MSKKPAADNRKVICCVDLLHAPNPLQNSNDKLFASATPVANFAGKANKKTPQVGNDQNGNDQSLASAIPVSNSAGKRNKKHHEPNNPITGPNNTSPIAANNPATKEDRTAANTPKSSAKKNKNGNGGIIPSSGNNPIGKKQKGNSVVGNGTSQKQTIQHFKDSIQKLEIREYVKFDPETHRYVLRIDTIALVNIPHYITTEPQVTQSDANKQSVKKLEQNNGIGIKNKNNNTILPGAKMDDATGSAVADNSNAKNALTAHKKSSKGWDWSGFRQKMRDFEYELGKVKVYPGLIGGINTVFFGGTQNSGFHLGMTTEFVVNEHLSIMGEFKYMQRFSSGSINNNYSKNNGNYVAPWWVVRTDSFTHSFNYSTMNSVELPISIRYKAGNFYVYAGGNLVYNFTINAEEISRPVIPTTPEVHIYSSTANWRPETPKIDISDFGSRFGIGYLLGTSYEFTRSIMVDGRVTQTLWDNAQTNGGKQISNLLYKGPSIQLSIIYRLNHQRPETVTPKYSF